MWFFMISLALELTRPCPVSTQMLAIVTMVGSSSIPDRSGSNGTGDFLARLRFREGFGVVPVSTPSVGSGVDLGVPSNPEDEARRKIFFLGVLLSVIWRFEQRTLLEGELAGLESGSIADT